MSVVAVTTFPEWGWDVYARHCISSWVSFWPGSILAYYEGAAPPNRVPGVEFRPLESEKRTKFLELDVPEPPNYLYDVKRFCHKVFAQLLALEETDEIFWIDADVSMSKWIPSALLRDILTRSFVSFLGRDTYTEAGVIAFNANHPEFPIFKDRYESCYTKGKIFNLPYWTDCHAFDYARGGGGYSMTPKGRGVDNVLEQSPLGEYMVHHKGNRKLRMEEQCDSVKSTAM